MKIFGSIINKVYLCNQQDAQGLIRTTYKYWNDVKSFLKGWTIVTVELQST